MNLPEENAFDAVLCDVDGTLTRVDSTEGMEHSIEFHLAAETAEVRGITFGEAMKRIEAVPGRESQCVSKLFPLFGIDAERFALRLKNDLRRHTVMPPDVPKFVKSLHEKGIKLYTATTNSKYITRVKLSALGLEESDFNGFFGGDLPECPLGKFDPNFFPSILRSIGFRPERVMMVGDEPEHDLFPALAAGLGCAVIIDRKSRTAIRRSGKSVFVNSLVRIGENL